jgi:hypothetical protein
LTTDYVLVVNTTAAEIKAVSLQIQDSVMGDVMSLYSTEGYMTSTTEIGEEASGTNASLTINYQSDGSDYLEKINTATDETIKTNDPNVAYNQTSSTILTSTYGFAIDLLVRTNVDDSNLLLQTDAMQRVYDGESNREDTEGSGSYCAIGGLANATDELKDALRFVFTNTKTGKILGCARIFNDSKLYLCDYTITEGGYLQVGKQSESDIIVSLERNATTPITVYVYLDGNKVTNAGAVELGKLKMKMNLQFSSDAELIPTRNEELMYQQ